MLDQYGDVLSVQDLCELFGCGKNRIYELLGNQTIKGFRLGSRTWKIPKVAVEDFLRKQAQLPLI